MSRIEKLERELHLKQLQINGLLNITQAINENLSAEGLFGMYTDFLSWHFGISKIALFFREGNTWECVTSSGIQSDEFNQYDLNEVFSPFKQRQGLENTKHPMLKAFDLVIPVMHKEAPIAYALLGGFADQEDGYNKLQFITTITNVIAVAIENKRLFKQFVAQELMRREVDVAAQIQQTLVPRRLPGGDKFELSSIYRPHSAVGGDYYDVVEFPDGKIIFCIADITGKGIPAALLMANFQASFHALVARQPSMEDLVQELNSSVWKVTHGDRFITLFLGKYDIHERTLHYINAGHTPPLVFSNGEVMELRNGTTSLGWLPELPFLEIGGLCLINEALIFTYTDGLTDIKNPAGEDFSDDKLKDFLRQHASLKAKDLNTELLAHVDRFKETEPFPDDITVLTCRVF